MDRTTRVYLFIVILSSVAAHFLFFGHPQETVFDEVHFGKFISGYFTHEYFFDIHPPLGKLLISGMGALGHFRPGFSFAEIGQKFPDQTYLWLRLLPSIAGALLPVVIFFLVLRLGLSKLGSFTAAMLVILENSLLVQSRFILLDAFLLLFGFGALLAYAVYRQGRKLRHLIATGALAALSLSVKWTGATFWGIILILESIYGYQKHIKGCFPHLKWGEYLRFKTSRLIIFFIVPLAIYFGIFAIHLRLLYKSGPGDAFMTQAFQKTLVGNKVDPKDTSKPLSFLGKFVELNKEMYTANATLTATHPYSSRWHSWPFMIRPIYYWYDTGTNGLASRIYFLGNPLIWWGSTAAMIYLIIELAGGLIHKVKNDPDRQLMWLALGAYAFNLLPFVGIKRAMFLYHYMVALIFAIMAGVFLIDRLNSRKRIFLGLLAASLALFIFFAPLSYGLPLTDKMYHLRTWLKTWI